MYLKQCDIRKFAEAFIHTYHTVCELLTWDMPHMRTPTFADLSSGALRLVNTRSTQFGGRLEVYYYSKWGTVCEYDWDLPDAGVACKQMGFADVSDSDSSLFGLGASSQDIWLADVACGGSESRLIDCRHSTLTSYCSHSDDVGIVCTTGELGWDGSSISMIIHQ